ncbi:MAG: aminotransferase class I/II-fold pyridoxal phosphate-dependent enzyme [Actinobacteria bacterium]|nr:aminotransferase class I/II-fold pyridoxal phosphate-dependent enzyme [Actinomycetota bacterium]
MKKLSIITESFTESVIREMTRICDAVKGYNLSQGFPDFPAEEIIKKAAINAIIKDHNQYPVTFGEPNLRLAIAEKFLWYNGVRINPDTDITVTCGATEAMIATLKAVINPGDEVIIFEPFYENYGPDAILSGAKPRYVTLYSPDWHYNPKELRSAFNSKTKAIIINTPNNPTGKVFSKQELQEISELCIRWDCLAITDEIYEHILYDDAKHISIASLPGMRNRSITINSISKTYSVTGWRVGWAIASTDITSRIRKVHDFLTVGAPTPFQEAAAFALRLPKEYYKKLQKRYIDARKFLFDLLLETGFGPCFPKGAYYIITEIDSLKRKLKVHDDYSFSRKLIELTRVATVPGSSFYADKRKGRNQVRFCFCKCKDTLLKVSKGLRKLKKL